MGLTTGRSILRAVSRNGLDARDVNRSWDFAACMQLHKLSFEKIHQSLASMDAFNRSFRFGTTFVTRYTKWYNKPFETLEGGRDSLSV